MNDLRRELAPVTGAAWSAIDDEARQTLQTYLAGRKLVDFSGPLGWAHSAESLGRVQKLKKAPCEGAEARLRQVQPLVELRVDFSLSREELDAVSRGAEDPDLDPLRDAARTLARAEDLAIFYGFSEAGITGLVSGSAHKPVTAGKDLQASLQAVTAGLQILREAGVSGPYRLALGPEMYTGLARTTTPAGYPIMKHLERLLDGPAISAPALEGAVLISLRGGDYRLVTGRDLSVGYAGHDARVVHLYLEESFTFRLLGPEAAVSLAGKAS